MVQYVDQLEHLLSVTKGQMAIGTKESAQQLIVSQGSSIKRSYSNQLPHLETREHYQQGRIFRQEKALKPDCGEVVSGVS
jgi:hypothetical protein